MVAMNHVTITGIREDGPFIDVYDAKELGNKMTLLARIEGDAARILSEYMARPKEPALKSWVSVDDQLPKMYQGVLLAVGGDTFRGVCMGYITAYGWRMFDDEGTALEGVTHWMPLPEPPATPET